MLKNCFKMINMNKYKLSERSFSYQVDHRNNRNIVLLKLSEFYRSGFFLLNF